MGMTTTNSRTFRLTDRELTYTETVYTDGRVESSTVGYDRTNWGLDDNGHMVRTRDYVSSKSTRNVGRALDLDRVAAARRDSGWVEVA